MTTATRRLDTTELEDRVKRMYEEVALEPDREFHFETGRPLTERLGYPPAELDRIPAPAIDSFAGVGYFLDLAAIATGETVLDLGSGSGTDTFLAALATGRDGQVIGVDMTTAQLAKSRDLAAEHGFAQAEFREAYIEHPPVEDASVDCVISNGVINLSPDKPAVFAAAARALRPGGRLALADIVTAQQLPERRHLRRVAVGGVHRRRDAARRLPRGDRGRGLHDRDLAREQRLPVRLRPRRQRDPEVRRDEHLAARPPPLITVRHRVKGPHMSNKVVINLATGLEDAERVTVAFLVGRRRRGEGQAGRDVPHQGSRAPGTPRPRGRRRVRRLPAAGATVRAVRRGRRRTARLPHLLHLAQARRRRNSSPTPGSQARRRCGTGSATSQPRSSATDRARLRAVGAPRR